MSLADRTPPTVEEFRAYPERFSNWGRWGNDDQLGTLNHITDETRRAAAALVREGRSVSCSNPIATAAVLSAPRNQIPVEHRMNVGDSAASDYIGISYHGHVNTHIDALCHQFTDDGRMYNGRPASDVTDEGAKSNSVDRWRNGIVTRGVLYDVARYRNVDHVSFEHPIHGWELQDVAEAQSVQPRAGDAVLVRAGADAFWAKNPDIDQPRNAPGLHASVLEFLYDTEAALLSWDLMEAPGQGHTGAELPIHRIAIPYMGLPLIDNANFEQLSATCAELNRWEFQLVIAPLVLIGGTGSPVNPIAIF
ncbi:MAG: cyclase family protein [Chloroflexi bacterium]|nr:cyclase family protein [Chloroflexota bacterium]